jgi:hypothetical protein
LTRLIAIANDTVYGLAASVWTKNIDKALMVTRRVRAGRFWVNTTLSGGPELPLGGFKQSGWGREAGMYGVEEYTQVKSVHIEIGKRSALGWNDGVRHGYDYVIVGGGSAGCVLANAAHRKRLRPNVLLHRSRRQGPPSATFTCPWALQS